MHPVLRRSRATNPLRALALTALAVSGLVATGGRTAALAGPTDAPATSLRAVSPATGWEAALDRSGLAGDHRFSSVAVGNVLDNGVAQIVAGFPDGTVRIFDQAGRQLRAVQVGSKAIQASPTLVHMGSQLDIVAADLDGSVLMFNASGRVLWHAKLTAGVFGTPAVADLEGNGRQDVVVTSYDQHIYAWHLDNGSTVPGWPVWVKDTIWSSPTIAHLDGDPHPEVVFGFDCAGDPTQPCYPNYGGYLGVLQHNGKWRPGFPILLPHQTVWSTPAVADLEGNGHSDIIVGTGNYFDGKHTWGGTKVYAYRSDGTPVPGWPATIGVNATSSPAVGDLTENGQDDVAIVGMDGRVHVFDRAGKQLWARCVTGQSESACGAPTLASASIADVNDDGRQDVVVGGSGTLYVFSATGAVEYTAKTAGSSDPFSNAPTILSIANTTRIFAEDTSRVGGRDIGRVYEWTTGTRLGKASWPGFKGGSARQGVLADHVWPASSTSRGSTLRVGQLLPGGSCLVSAGGRFRAMVQGNGALTVSEGSRLLWTSGASLSGTHLGLQGDGNLVMRTAENRSMWASATSGTHADRLVMQPDGNLVLYHGGTAVWSTRTG